MPQGGTAMDERVVFFFLVKPTLHDGDMRFGKRSDFFGMNDDGSGRFRQCAAATTELVPADMVVFQPLRSRPGIGA